MEIKLLSKICVSISPIRTWGAHLFSHLTPSLPSQKIKVSNNRNEYKSWTVSLSFSLLKTGWSSKSHKLQSCASLERDRWEEVAEVGEEEKEEGNWTCFSGKLKGKMMSWWSLTCNYYILCFLWVEKEEDGIRNNMFGLFGEFFERTQT